MGAGCFKGRLGLEEFVVGAGVETENGVSSVGVWPSLVLAILLGTKELESVQGRHSDVKMLVRDEEEIAKVNETLLNGLYRTSVKEADFYSEFMKNFPKIKNELGII